MSQKQCSHSWKRTGNFRMKHVWECAKCGKRVVKYNDSTHPSSDGCPDPGEIPYKHRWYEVQCVKEAERQCVKCGQIEWEEV